MSAPLATTNTNDILPGLCECLSAQNPAWPRAWPEKSAVPIRDAVTAFASAAINEANGWWRILRA